jgi:hypothetical protein
MKNYPSVGGVFIRNKDGSLTTAAASEAKQSPAEQTKSETPRDKTSPTAKKEN